MSMISVSASYCHFCSEFPFGDVGRVASPKQGLGEVPLTATRSLDSLMVRKNVSCERCRAVKVALLHTAPHKLQTHASVEVTYRIHTNTYKGKVSELQVELTQPKGSLPDRNGRQTVSMEKIDVLETFRKCFPVVALGKDDTTSNWGCTPTGCLREVGPTVDYNMLRFWDRMCRENGHTCHNPPHASGYDRSSIRVRLIDVRRNCLVDTTLEEPFVALSYVWGSGPATGLSMSSKAAGGLASFYKKEALGPLTGSTTKPEPPLTVKNAIQLTRELGYRLLFVDRLCIDQDNEEDFRFYVEAMNQIYGLAALTIVAAAGSSADSGLPGIAGTPRQMEQRPGFDVISSEAKRSWRDRLKRHGGSDKAVQHSRVLRIHDFEKRPETLVEDSVARSAWVTRGWTFQERLLSPRLLVFTLGGAFWSCWQGRFSESVAYERVDIGSSVDSMAGDLRPDESLASLPEPERILSNSKRLTGLVSAYKRRKLTFPQDALRAFQGVLAAFSRINSPWPFHFGISHRALPIELTWGLVPDELPTYDTGYSEASTSAAATTAATAAASTTMTTTTATTATTTASRGLLDATGFPSWSWLAAEGEVLWEREIFNPNTSFLLFPSAMTTSMYEMAADDELLLREIYAERRPLLRVRADQRPTPSRDALAAALPRRLVFSDALCARAIVFGGFVAPCIVTLSATTDPDTTTSDAVSLTRYTVTLQRAATRTAGPLTHDITAEISWQQYPFLQGSTAGGSGGNDKTISGGREALAVLPLGEGHAGTSLAERRQSRVHCLLLRTVGGDDGDDSGNDNDRAKANGKHSKVRVRVGKFALKTTSFAALRVFLSLEPVVLC